MTTIACSREVMAADSRVVIGDSSYTAPKIQRVGGSILGGAGMSYYINQFIDMAQKQEFRQFNLLKDDTPSSAEFIGLILWPEGIYVVDSSLNIEKIDDEFFAIGSGAQAARAAMRMGADPISAVKVAAEYDSMTGLPVKSLRLKGIQCSPTKR